MAQNESEQPFDLVGFIMAFEGDTEENLTDEQIIDGFQHMIDSGIVWQLQGFYGRAAMDFIRDGRCTITLTGGAR